MPLTLLAPAKINLSLEVLGRRDDGFHQVRMLMVSVGLCDRLDFKIRRDGQIRLRGAGLAANLDNGKNNLVTRAADLLAEQAPDGVPGVDIRLFKKIPLAAGLAGGSSNAAVTLLALNKLWRLHFSMPQLEKLALRLGSDVPFCLHTGAAMASGRGEKLKQVQISRRYGVLLVNPGFEVSTPWAYKRVKIRKNISINYSQKTLKAVQDKKIDDIRSYCINDLESATATKYKKIPELISTMLENRAITSKMSGSGPTVWGLFSSLALAEKALKNIKKKEFFCSAVPMIFTRPKS